MTAADTASPAPDLSEVAPAGEQVGVRLGSRRYVAGFDLDPVAVAERERWGIGALGEFADIFALWELPLHGQVLLSDLSGWVLERLQSLPEGLVSFEYGRVQRRATVPVRVASLVAVRARAQSALAAFGDQWWAPVEVAVARRGASSTTVRKAEACGIGVHAGGEWLARPLPKRVGRPTPLLWWQAELVFGTWLRGAGR